MDTSRTAASDGMTLARTMGGGGGAPPVMLDGIRPERQPSVHDGLSITAFVLAFILPVLGFILGWVAIAAAHKAGRRSSGLAQAAMWVGGAGTVVIIVVIAVLASATADSVNQANLFNQQLNDYLDCVNSQASNPALQCTPPAG